MNKHIWHFGNSWTSCGISKKYFMLRKNCDDFINNFDFTHVLMIIIEQENAKDASKVEIMWGNGLRPSIWQQFTERLVSKVMTQEILN